MLRGIPPTEIYPLPPGDPGTAATTAVMLQKIDEGKKSSAIRAKALEILNAARVRAFDWMGQARAIYDWVLGNVTFTPDVSGEESVQTAEWTLQYRRGDCDCISVLMCALLETIGMRCRLVTVASDPRAPEQFSHVYPEVRVGNRWVAVDAARRRAAFGRSPTNYFRKRSWGPDPGESSDMGRLGIMPVARMRAAQSQWIPPVPAQQRSGGRIRFRRRLTGLGDDGFDWSQLPDIITAGETGAANIIAASRATPYNLYPTTSMPPAGGGVVRGGGYPPPPSPGFFGLSTNTLLLGLLLIGGIAVAARR